MNNSPVFEGFSKLSKELRLKVLSEATHNGNSDVNLLKQFWLENDLSRYSLDDVSENMVSHFFLPYSIAPNFLINGKIFYVPMVTEESSVVAAASSAAKFWLSHDGFHTRVISTVKIGQIHFNWPGNFHELKSLFPVIETRLKESVANFLVNMEKRGGGIQKIELLNFSDKLVNYCQIKVSFETVDAMGANLINSCLEEMAGALKTIIGELFSGDNIHCDILMSILSNYSPDCIVECTLKCKTDQFKRFSPTFTSSEFADRFKRAVDIANIDIYRAVTHNKGIFNGIDAVLIATGNDFRAVEAGGHAFAAKDGPYKSLTRIKIEDDNFYYTLQMPLAIGTRGGLTTVHPVAKISLEILGNPSAIELMQIVAAAGLANNFSAIRALITTGIQKGHMKFHLNKILNTLNSNEKEKKKASLFFKNSDISYAAVKNFITKLREQSPV
jgi:hydroxymethylglutaryl-CoA reductase